MADLSYTHERNEQLAAHINAFNRWNDAWQRKNLREALWLYAVIDNRHEIAHLQQHFGVTRQKIQHTFNWLRRWDWQIVHVCHGVYDLIPPENYQPDPPRPGQLSSSERRKRGWSMPKPKRKPLTVEGITSLRAQGYTMRDIARYYGVEFSTPYQVLRRAKLREEQRNSPF